MDIKSTFETQKMPKRPTSEDYKVMEKIVLNEDYNKVKKCLEFVVKFGKYKGYRYIDILVNNPDYFQWLIDQKILNEKVYEAYTLFKQILLKVN